MGRPPIRRLHPRHARSGGSASTLINIYMDRRLAYGVVARYRAHACFTVRSSRTPLPSFRPDCRSRFPSSPPDPPRQGGQAMRVIGRKCCERQPSPSPGRVHGFRAIAGMLSFVFIGSHMRYHSSPATKRYTSNCNSTQGSSIPHRGRRRRPCSTALPCRWVGRWWRRCHKFRWLWRRQQLSPKCCCTS